MTFLSNFQWFRKIECVCVCMCGWQSKWGNLLICDSDKQYWCLYYSCNFSQCLKLFPNKCKKQMNLLLFWFPSQHTSPLHPQYSTKCWFGLLFYTLYFGCKSTSAQKARPETWRFYSICPLAPSANLSFRDFTMLLYTMTILSKYQCFLN